MPPVNPSDSRFSGRSPRLSSSRRRFLQLSGAALSGAVLTNCARNIGSTTTDASPVPASSTGGGDNTLHVYSWSTYIDDDLLKSFEQETGIKVIADIYDSNETMLAKMVAGGGKQYSIIYPSDYMVGQMAELNLLSPIDKERVPGYADLLAQWKSPSYDVDNTNSVPYAWGTTGLVYNTEVLTKPVTDWSYLWNNQKQLSGKMTLLNDVREVMGFTLKSLGFSNSTTDPKQIEAAYKKLAQLKPAVSSFTTDGWRDQIVVGDLLLSHAYSVDGIDAMASNSKLKYIIPTSGATVWTDTMVIPKNAPNIDAAYKWIEYTVNPETAAVALARLKFATPNQKTLELLPSELRENPALIPPEAVLAKCEVLDNVDSATELYDRYWTQLTSV